jgi:hypothetical protein
MRCTLGGSEKLLFSDGIATYYRKFHTTCAYRPGVVNYFCLEASRGSYVTATGLEVYTCRINLFRSAAYETLCYLELVIFIVLCTEACSPIIRYASSSLFLASNTCIRLPSRVEQWAVSRSIGYHDVR